MRVKDVCQGQRVRLNSPVALGRGMTSPTSTRLESGGWLVLTIGEGMVAGPFPRKADAVRWIEASEMILRRTRLRSGAYEYVCGYEDAGFLSTYFVSTVAEARRDGFEAA